MIDQQLQPEKQAITEMVLKIYVAHFLRPNITAGEMIRVFDLVEHNEDGISRLNSLAQENFIIGLTEQQRGEALDYLSDYPEHLNGKFKKDILLRYLADYQLEQLGKRHLTQKVTALNDAGFLHPTLTAGAMICVFDLIEHNEDGEARLRRLIEEECTGNLTKLQIEEAVEMLNDFPRPN